MPSHEAIESSPKTRARKAHSIKRSSVKTEDQEILAQYSPTSRHHHRQDSTTSTTRLAIEAYEAMEEAAARSEAAYPSDDDDDDESGGSREQLLDGLFGEFDYCCDCDDEGDGERQVERHMDQARKLLVYPSLDAPDTSNEDAGSLKDFVSLHISNRHDPSGGNPIVQKE